MYDRILTKYNKNNQMHAENVQGRNFTEIKTKQRQESHRIGVGSIGVQAGLGWGVGEWGVRLFSTTQGPYS